MKNVVIPFNKPSEGKLIVELTKLLGFKPRVEESKGKAIKPMQWVFMPEDDAVLEKEIKEAKKALKEGKGYTTKQVREIVSKWK